MKIFTIGFTQHSAEDFFEKLKQNYVKRVIDIRINKKSQLAGFAKGSDLPFLLSITGDIDYIDHAELAPTKELLKAYRSKDISWAEFEKKYIKQLSETTVIAKLKQEEFDGACLLCSEHKPDQCHRRLLAEILSKNWKFDLIHL
jgi:uncharacterized protein (DUF488 family)